MLWQPQHLVSQAGNRSRAEGIGPLRTHGRGGIHGEGTAGMAIAPQRTGIGLRRHFTTSDVHPYDEVVWERRDARITNYRDNVVAFEQLDVEVPAEWSVNATNILSQKYFRGTLGTDERETSLRQVADRIVDTICAWGIA